MEKILITGTGRCGTTFLIKLFSFLGLNTGYNRDNYTKYIHSNCNSGMERGYKKNFYILKNPKFMTHIETIVEDKSLVIKTVLIPLRDLNECAESRVKHDKTAGGLWNANDKFSQIQYFKDILTNYIFVMNKYDINTIFIDFDKMINDKTYLFNKFKSILDENNIDFETFSNVYDEVSQTSKPK